MSTLRLPALARASCRDEPHRASLAVIPVVASGVLSAAIMRHATGRLRHTLTMMAVIMKGQ